MPAPAKSYGSVIRASRLSDVPTALPLRMKWRRWVDRINASGADILFIAMGSPRQEKWMSEYAGKLTTVKVCQGIGGTLDTIAGTVKRAPVFWQKLGLEWFYRLLCQPSRFKRQLRCFKFALEIFRQKYFPCRERGKTGAPSAGDGAPDHQS